MDGTVYTGACAIQFANGGLDETKRLLEIILLSKLQEDFMAEKKREPQDLKWWIGIIGAVVAIAVGVSATMINWKTLSPPKPTRQAGLTVMVTPSAVDISPNGKATVTWTLAETNNLGVTITSRTGEWQTPAARVVKIVGPIQTEWRIEPSGRKSWTDPIVLYEDAANEAVDGYLVLDQGFEGQDDNGHRVIGKARVRVRVMR